MNKCSLCFVPLRSQKASLEDTLLGTEQRFNMEMEKYNSIILRLEEELGNLRANIQQQTQEYEVLLNMKMKLEAEISTYKSLLDGGDFRWEPWKKREVFLCMMI